MTSIDELPYGEAVSRALAPMRQGFKYLNRYVTGPALRTGFGPLLATPATGSMLLLRTVGRKSGLVRETPLGYALIDGRIVVIAGYGRRADWFRNALAHPQVEVVLPGARLRGLAKEITDPDERLAAFCTAIEAMSVVGYLTVGDLGEASPERLEEMAEAFPALAITPTAVLPGPFDPGGVGTRWVTAVGVVGPLALAWLIRRSRRS